MSYANKESMKDYRQAQIVRMDIISRLYKRGYSYREIRAEVMARLDLQSYSLRTVKKDVERLLAEWRETRIENTDYSLQLELQRIDDLLKEAWEAWEKSKQEYEKRKAKQIGVPNPDDERGGGGGVVTLKMEQTAENISPCGDPRFLELIHKLLMERRKLLGLYSPDKTEVTGDFSFANLLMQTGVIDEQE